MFDFIIMLFWIGVILALAGFVFNIGMMIIFMIFGLIANMFGWIAEQFRVKD